MQIGEETYLTCDELASKFEVSKSTIQKWVYKGYIPSAKIGRTRYFSETAVTEWMNEKLQKES